ncbi:MAG TPA: uroporphyrinogen-III synthase [Myxococcales bacterium]|nr:uroporphyrinogen-III synthase [Myxococcales bacterium]
MSLRGARALVTRAAEDATELEELLRQRGAVPMRMPCIELADGEDAARIAGIVQSPPSRRPELIVVASPHAARRLRALCGSIEVPLAAVGAATARELAGEVIVPATGVGAEALVATLRSQVAGKRVLVPRAEGGNPALVEGLRAAGASVEVLTLYRTVLARSADLSVLQGLDAISFASGSAVRGFVSLAGAGAARGVAVACMGQNCAEEAKKAGIEPDAVAAGGLNELCDALALAVRLRRG